MAAAQALPPTVRLVLTRGHEPRSATRTALRILGALIFAAVYPWRLREVPAIFGHNGHQDDGTHLDISVQVGDEALVLLPLGVFTPMWLMRSVDGRHGATLAEVRRALEAEGFKLHTNRTEARQIHCDLTGAAPDGGALVVLLPQGE